MGVSKPAAGAFAGSSASPLFSLATSAAVAAGLTVMQAKRKRTWEQKQKRNELFLQRHPPPLLTKRELRKRTTKVNLMVREDVWATEFPIYIDPRDEKYQWSLMETKGMMERPDYEDVAQIRAKMGIAMPPYTMTDVGATKLRESMSARTSAGKDAQGAETEEVDKKGKKKDNKGVDLGDIDSKFMQFKGIKLTKKQQAQFSRRK